ncbi:MAG TPA: sulfur oxidation c-type cytochrome SoxX [Ectothiorhodospiraceae bacterium]|nr:sulfur oxidation c-type cytochrome SoxX [Ectothiorhodospiraceae bacterium]
MLSPKSLLILLMLLAATALNAAEYLPWSQQNFAIDSPLGGFIGNPERGRLLVSQKSKGNCLACHRLPIKDTEFHGTIGPELTGVGNRLTMTQLRLRVSDEKQVNPFSIMPGYHSDPKRLNRVRDDYQGQTILSAQEIEDIVSYLVSLK